MLKLFGKALSFQPSGPFSAAQVRWKRKPMWMPQAKTKMFKIPPRPNIPIEEREELKRLFNNYRTQIKSIKKYLQVNYALDLRQTVDEEKLRADFESDFQLCSEVNEKWNAELKVMRERRFEEEGRRDVEIAKERLAERARINDEKHQRAEEEVRRQKALAHTFITRENIDEAIEKALASTVDYNFAIDLNGNRIVGRETNDVQT